MTEVGHIGKYELLKQLAVGGMAEIYLSRQSGPEGFSKLVVIKRILPSLATQERFVHMFLDEARVAARFNHPNIVQIFDLGREDDSFYIAMEYIPGEDIKAVVRRCAKKRHKIPLEHIVKIGSGVLDGLHYAHSQKTLDEVEVGVVHRDVSPHNIIVSFQGGIKLVDFGIAKARSEISTTIPGRVKGKHAYMSPEQVRGEDLDGRSDVFAVGIVMYELLTWSRLFKRSKHIETLRAVCESTIRPPSQLNPAIDAELERIVLKALERDLSKRYQTAQQMQIDLEDYLLKAGLRSNPVLLGQFMTELYADKLQAQEKALTVAKADNLENALLAVGDDKSPDLVAFLDMFFADSGTSSVRGDGTGAPEFTPSADYTPLPPPGEGPVSERRRREIPARARGEYMPRTAPPRRAPNGMSVKHVSPGADQVDDTQPVNNAQPPGGPADLLDPAAGAGGEIFDPAAHEDPIVDSEAYADELEPMGSGSKGKIVMFLVFLVILGGVGALIYSFKDSIGKVEVPEFGTVRVNSIPGGADVYLDDKHQQAQTPMFLDLIKPGQEHVLRVSVPGLPPWESKFTLTDTTKPLEIKAILSKDAAEKARMVGKPIVAGIEGEGVSSIEVLSDPPKAMVFLDGVDTGKKTPFTLKKVPAGLDHVIMLSLDGKTSVFDRLKLEADVPGKIELKLEDGDKLEGRLKVRFESEPEGATVSINGYPMNKKTPMAAKLLAGAPSEIEIEHKDVKGKKTLMVRPVPSVDLTVFVKLK